MHPDFLKDIDICSPEIIALLIGSGFLIGIINTIAGSGTAIGYAVFVAIGFLRHGQTARSGSVFYPKPLQPD